MKSKMKIMAIALSAVMMSPTALAYASDTDSYSSQSNSGSLEIMPLSGNIKNEPYTFVFRYDGATQGTVGRAKESKSTCYIQIDKHTVDSCRVYIDGSKTRKGSTWYNQTCRKDKYEVGGYCVANRKGKFSIQNRVRQNGFYYARLTGWGNSLRGTLAGNWSPDSTKKYTILNHK